MTEPHISLEDTWRSEALDLIAEMVTHLGPDFAGPIPQRLHDTWRERAETLRGLVHNPVVRKCVLEVAEPSREWVIDHRAGNPHTQVRIVEFDGEPVTGAVMEPDEDGLMLGPFIWNCSADQTVISWRVKPHTGKVVVTW
jgi:hypothetical protein